jgi:hypothetical protein
MALNWGANPNQRSIINTAREIYESIKEINPNRSIALITKDIGNAINDIKEILHIESCSSSPAMSSEAIQRVTELSYKVTDLVRVLEKHAAKVFSEVSPPVIAALKRKSIRYGGKYSIPPFATQKDKQVQQIEELHTIFTQIPSLKGYTTLLQTVFRIMKDKPRLEARKIEIRESYKKEYGDDAESYIENDIGLDNIKKYEEAVEKVISFFEKGILLTAG